MLSRVGLAVIVVVGVVGVVVGMVVLLVRRSFALLVRFFIVRVVGVGLLLSRG